MCANFHLLINRRGLKSLVHIKVAKLAQEVCGGQEEAAKKKAQSRLEASSVIVVRLRMEQ